MARRKTASRNKSVHRSEQDAPIRTWTVLAQDPGFVDSQGKALTAQIEVPDERLEAGPKGTRVHVLDYDGSTNRFYGSRDKDFHVDFYEKPKSTGALVRDPYFHQQNTFALVQGTLFQFEKALGRPVDWGFAQSHQIKVAPHAFADANAYYSRESESLNFGYFPDAKTGRQVYTCLSHDIVVHETAHALLDGLRPYYLKPSSPDQAGFHEGFADLVALLSVFRHKAIIEHALKPLANAAGRLPTAAMDVDVLGKTALTRVAEQMGSALEGVRGQALRQSVNIRHDKRLYLSERYAEEHDRGELLVAPMIRSFLGIWIKRLKPLRDRATSLPASVVAEEGCEAAQHLLHIAIRALDYMPPVDLSFPDYVSALLTADRELFPGPGKYNYRETLREEFAAFGIIPATGPKGEGCWDPPPNDDFTMRGVRLERLKRDRSAVFRFVWENRDALGIYPDAFTRVTAVRLIARFGRDGVLLLETVAEYVQTLKVFSPELASLGIRKPKGMRTSRMVTLYGGGSLIFNEFGQLKYHVGTGVCRPAQSARLQSLWDNGYFDDAPAPSARIAQMHRNRQLHPIRNSKEEW